jgi:hypothetical protein
MSEQPWDDDGREPEDRLTGDSSGGAVGQDDADADALRSGVDVDPDLVDPTGIQEDSDGAPVGRADADADAERSGADADRL